MAIDLPPYPQPSTSLSRNDFNDAMDAFVNWMYTATPQFDAVATALNLISTNGASVSSVSIGAGSKSFTASTGKSWVKAMTLKIGNSATNWMLGEVSSYDPGTGALVVNIRKMMGSGTFSDWVISLAPPEPDGSMVFLGSVSAASSAQVDIENDFSEYDYYQIIGTGIHYNGDWTVSLSARFKIGGAYDTGSNYQNNSAAAIAITADIGSVVGNMAFVMDIFSPALAKAKLAIIRTAKFNESAASTIYANNSLTGPLTGVRFYTGAQNITVGKFSLYGIKND